MCYLSWTRSCRLHLCCRLCCRTNMLSKLHFAHRHFRKKSKRFLDVLSKMSPPHPPKKSVAASSRKTLINNYFPPCMRDDEGGQHTRSTPLRFHPALATLFQRCITTCSTGGWCTLSPRLSCGLPAQRGECLQRLSEVQPRAVKDQNKA